jgi:hypothetical protein
MLLKKEVYMKKSIYLILSLLLFIMISTCQLDNDKQTSDLHGRYSTYIPPGVKNPPGSGSRGSRWWVPIFNPTIWNNVEDVKVGSQCYMYACNIYGLVGPNPGEASKELYDNPCGIVSIEKPSKYVCLCGAIHDGLEFAGTHEPTYLPKGKMLVCLVYDDKKYKDGRPKSFNYHWYRQDRDGTWSHKDGTKKATQLDYADNPITSVETADRHYVRSSDNKVCIYNEVVGYFYVDTGRDNGWGEEQIILDYLGDRVY